MATRLAGVALTVDQKGAALAARVERVAPAVYWVASASGGEAHVVADLARLGIGEGLACDCPAAAHGRRCCHVAAVEIRRRLEAVRASPPVPATRPPRAA